MIGRMPWRNWVRSVRTAKPKSDIDRQTGTTIARVLAGAWRQEQASIDISDVELKSIWPLLQSTGAGPLLWHRLKSSPEMLQLDHFSALSDDYRLAAIQFELGSAAIEKLSEFLSGECIEFVLFKGRSLAGLYAETFHRPTGDIDICVAPGQFERTAELLGQSEIAGSTVSIPGTFKCDLPGQFTKVDLHRNLEKFRLPSLTEVFERAETRQIGCAEVLIPAAADHLKLLCMHFLIHGGWRPIWLCDVAAMIEAIPEDFDWNNWLGIEEPLRNYLGTALSIAHELLDAKPKWRPKLQLKPLPNWIRLVVLSSWTKQVEHYNKPAINLKRMLFRNEVWRTAKSHWPNPVRATVETNNCFDNRSRWTSQTKVFVNRAIAILGSGTGSRF
jgi:Uncharacterised nucleotidyltransferase